MVQHVLPKGFKRIRYDGVQATKTFAKVKAVIHAALAKVEGVGKGAVTIMARLTYRQRYEQSTGRDPFRCPHCGAEMAVWRIWHPKYGVIYDEGEVIKRGTYTSTAQRAGPCRQADIPQVRPEGVMCKDDLLSRCGADDFREPPEVGWAPMSPAHVTDILSQQKGFETELGVFEIADGIFTRPGEIPDGFLFHLGDIDHREIPRAG